MFENFFQERLVQLRMAKGVSAREMSLAIGLSPGYINGIENGKGLPSMQVFFYMCEYLKVTPAHFFDSGYRYPGEYEATLREMMALKYEYFSCIKAIIRGLRR